MKKLLLLILINLTLGLALNAQISIDANNTIGSFEIVRRAHDTISSSLSVGNAGTSQQWYFTSAQDNYEDTMTFTSPTMLPGYTEFPASNLGVKLGDLDSTYLFFKKNSTGLYIVGRSFYQGGTLMTMQTPATIITFPSQMGSLYGYNTSVEAAKFSLGLDPDGPGPHLMVDSVRIIRNIDESSTIDGLGTMSTPLGVFQTLRQNTETITIDSTWQKTTNGWELLSPTMQNLFNWSDVIVDSSYVMRWWTNDFGIKFPVVEVKHNNAGTVYEATWMKAVQQADVDNMEKQIVHIYPNPANDMLNINTVITGLDRVVIYDMTGNKVLSHQIEGELTTFDVGTLDSGLYLIRLLDKSNEAIHESKMSIVK